MSSSPFGCAWIRPPRKLFAKERRQELRRELRRWRRSISCEKLEDRCLLVADWSNVLQPLNASGDDTQIVSPIDALLVINELNSPSIRPASTSVLPPAGTNGQAPPPFVDVNCDNNVTPLDALLIINAINSQALDPSWRFVQSGIADPTGGVANDACSPRIKEGSSLVTSLVSDVVIPAGSNLLTFQYQSLQFDTSSSGRALDAFEAALLDDSGRSLVRTLGSGKDSFFNVSEGLAAATTANVTVSNNKVALSLVDVLPGTSAKLVLRLVNNDGDTTTAVTIPSIKFERSESILSPGAPPGVGGNTLLPAAGGAGSNTSVQLSGSSNIPGATNLPANILPGSGAVPGRPANGATSNASSAGNLSSNGSTVNGSAPHSGPVAPRSPNTSPSIDNRGTEFWIGFPDNLFEGNNRPQKVLYISGEVATTGVVDIPGLIDPRTAQPFRQAFVVNPGDVTVVELPSADIGDDSDNDTDFDVEVELIARVQKKGIHVVTQEPVTIYGLDLAVSTSDAFLALPVSALGSEYINLGYQNTFASISHVEGTQFLVVASQDDTQVTLNPGRYSGATTASNVSITRPNGTSTFNLGNTDGRDIGPYTTEAAGTYTLTVRPPFDGYSGKLNFEMVDLATAAVPASIGQKVTLDFATGRQAKVVAFDVVAGQRLYIDTINPNPSPNATPWLVSPSGVQTGLAPQSDFDSVGNLFGALSFAETGKYYILVVGEQEAAFQFAFQVLDFDNAPRIVPGTALRETFTPAGRAAIYRYDATAGQTVFFDALDDNRLTNVTVYGPGGQLLEVFTQSDQHPITFPEAGTYFFGFSSATFGQPSYAFRLLDLQAAPNLQLATSTTIDVVDGQTTAFRFAATATQQFEFTIQNSLTFRATFQLLDAAGNNVPLSDSGNQRFATLLTDGSYTLLVGALTVAESGSVTLLPTLIDGSVVNKSGFDTSQSLSIVPGGTATYQFSAPAGTRYIIDGLDTASQNLFLELTAPDGSRIDFFGEVQDMPRFHPGFLPQSGTYTITLRGSTAADSGSYNFRVLDLDTFAVPLPFNTVVNATRTIGREINVYAFNALAGDRFNFDALAGSFAFGFYSPSLNVPFTKGIFGAATTVEADGILRITQSGRHYLVLHGEDNSPTSVSFNLQNLSVAPILPLGVEASGPLAGNGSVVMRVNLTAGQRLRVDNLEQDADEVNLAIFKVNGRTLFSDNFTSTDSQFFSLVPETGEYFVVISNRLTTIADYRFRIDDMDAAPILTFDADLQVTLDPGQSAKVFRIDALAGESIQLDNLGTSGQAFTWQVSGPVNQTLNGHNDGLDFSARVISPGTHYLTLVGRQNSGPLTISFRATRTPGAVVPLFGVNTAVNLDVGINETKTFTFTAPTGRLIYFNIRQSLFEIPTHTVALNRGETYLLRDLAGSGFGGAPDLTGSIITSTKPVAVFGGNRATFVPSQFFAADHLVEQLPPTSTWGRDFVTVPLNTGSNRGDLFRLLAQADDTELKINGNVVGKLNRGEFFEQNLVAASHIVSDKPILVAQYAYSQNYYRTDPGGNATFTGDPLMLIVPPSEQFLASYTVATPVESAVLGANRFDRNYINIVAPAAAVGSIELEGVAIQANKFTAIGTSGFFGAQIPVTLGSYQLAGPLPFGVFVYGFGSFDSYGYVGGQALSSVAEVSSVVLSPASSSKRIGDTLLLTARVADSSGAPLKGIRVDFDSAGVNAQRGFGFSDENGLVQFTYVGASAGRDVVTAAVGQLLDDSIIDWRADAAAPQVIVTAPLAGSSLSAGTTLIATGQALADFPLATLDLVTVNGVPLTSLDAAGNFFVSLFVGPGDNEFEFTAIDSNGQVGSTTITITGTQPNTAQIDFTQFADVSGSFRELYARSSFNLSNRSFLTETAIENVGQFPADVPLLVGITNISDPLVLVRNADGQTPDGIPYYDFSGLVTGRSLNPASQTGLLSVEFLNPNQTQFTYDLIFLGKLNEAPEFTSLPTTVADLNREYVYDVQAIDRNQDTLTYELVEAPTGMSIDATTGLIRWTPTDADRGLHVIDIRAIDSRQGVSSQRFTLEARPVPANRAPLFTSIPVALAEVGQAYRYSAQSLDADGDALVYGIISGPSGMTIQSDSGAITWTPSATQLGTQSVVVVVTDARGAAAEQAFTLLVISPLDNAAPVIVSSPPSTALRSGFTYQVIAIDAERERLSYRLLSSPAGMTIDPNGLVQWTPNPSQVTPVAVNIEVLDERGGRQTQSFVLSVFDNQDPTITSSPNLAATVNTTYTYQVTATDPNADALQYRLLSAPRGLTLDASSGQMRWDVTSAAYAREAVSLTVSDGRGGTATQSFVIEVTGGQTSTLNLDPYFVSDPSRVGSVGTTWLYTAGARDPENQALTFDLPLAPRGMVIDPRSGRMGWTPAIGQVGSQRVVVRVTDPQRGVSLQAFEVNVDAANSSPVITSLPITTASPGNAWEYRLHAQDAEGDALTFELESPTSLMSLTRLSNADSQAVLSFTPSAAGAIDVVLVARDSRGGRTEQRFTIQVSASANIAPEFVSQPRRSIATGQPWFYFVSTLDQNSDPVSVTLTAAPSGMTLDPQARAVRWTPALTQLGTHVITLSASDNRGGVDTQTVTLTVVASSENDAPRIASLPPAFRASVGEPFAYDLRAEDADGDPVEWTMVEAPPGASLDRRYGNLRWTPSLEQTGLQRFVISAKDPSGLEALQSFSLNVSGANLGPSILSRATSEAIADERYVVGVWAVDPENDPLTFSLSNAPVGMTIDSNRGIVRWTPTLAQLGSASATVAVTDSHGNVARQRFQINVTQAIRNREPVISSRAIFRARVDAVYQYDVDAVDPEGSDITYSLVSAPSGMQINATSGLITWTPTAAQVGSQLVQVVAQDGAGGQSLQRFAILARANQGPVIRSQAPTTIAIGGRYQYDLQVNDPENDGLSYKLVAGPAGMAIDGLGRVSWDTAVGVPLSNPVTLRVVDAFGAEAVQEFVLAVTPDTTPPRVDLRLSANPLRLGENSVVLALVSDNVGVVDVTLTMNGQPLILDANRSVTIPGDRAGLVQLKATARDASGNEGVSTVDLRIIDPADTSGPIITLTSPAPSAHITSLVDVVGSITDNNLLSYRVDVGRADLVDINQPEATDPDYKTIASGNAVKVDAVLAQFDPTMLTNDDYVLRILASDLSGNTSSKTIPLHVEGNLKLGEVNLEFTDLTVPVAGIPISINRTYNSRNAGESGDFGFGWTLSVQDAQIRETIPVNAFEADGLSFAATPFREGTRVYLTNPAGRRVGFTFRPTPQFSLFGGGSFLPKFVPDVGVYDTLDVGSVPLRKIGNEFYSGFFGEPFNPSAYRLTTKEGIVYEYGQFSGLANVIDRAGNRLEFRPDGIFSSSGPAVQFVRDPQGRISKIIDPLGNTLSYSYNLANELIRFTDQAGLTRDYSYLASPKHFLRTIVDPNGEQIFSAQFDSAGRLTSSTNSIGARLTNTFDVAGTKEVTTDPLGNITTVQFDQRGNIAQVQRPGGGMISMQYDGNDNLTKAVDEAGNIVTQAYDAKGNLISITDPLGKSYVSTFNSAGQITSTTDPLGRTSNFVYDSTGNLVRFVNALGEESTSAYDAQGRVISTTDGRGLSKQFTYTTGARAASVVFAGNVSSSRIAALSTPSSKNYEYNQLGQLIRETDENGHVTQYAYDAIGRPVSVTDATGARYTYLYAGDRMVEGIDPLGRRTRVEYDDLGRRVRTLDALGGVASVTYDANNQVIASTDELGQATTYRYRPDSRLESETDALGRTTRYEYDAVGNRTAVVDALGHRWTFGYDALSRLLSETDPLGAVTRYAYDAVGNRVSTTDAGGNTTRYAYDNLNRLVRQTDALGNSYSIEYDRNGNPVKLTDPAGGVSTFEYDDKDRLVKAIDAAGFVRQQAFDAYGNRISVTDETGNTTELFYDAANRGVRSRDSLGRETTRVFDAFGNTIRLTNALGQATSYEVDSLNRVISIATADGRISRKQYDAVGNQTQFTDPLGNVTGFTYDKRNRIAQRTDPLGRSASFTYDAVGNLVSKLDRNGREIRYTYDAARQLTKEEWFNGSTLVETIGLTYDAFGSLLTAGDSRSSLTFTYDALNRLKSQDNLGTPGVPRTTWSADYDSRGNLERITDSSGTAFSRTFDSRNRTTSSRLSGGGVEPVRADFAYDAAGRRTSETRYADLAGNQKIGRSQWLYNTQGQLTDLTHFNALDAVLVDFDYAYDAASQLTDESATSGSVRYSYDSAGQLIGADRATGVDESYAYDVNGNRQGNGEVMGANNQLLSDSQFRYSYDNEGNLATKTRISTGEVTQFTYDHRNRLTQVQVRTATGTVTSQSAYVYDVLDRRILVDNNGTKMATLYVGSAPWVDFNATGQVIARYLPGEGIDELVARFRPGEGTSWYLVDRLGSVRNLVDGTGAIADTIQYDSFGSVLTETAPTRGDRFKFAGREFDAPTGLYYNRARYYDPSVGEFLSEDPLVFGGGDANLQRYAGNDPVNATDPTGTQAISETGGLAAFVSVYADFALNYGADEPFTFRIGCKAGACGISGTTDPSTKLKFSFAVPGSDGRLKATVNLGTKESSAALSSNLGPLNLSGDTKGKFKATLSKKIKDIDFSASTDGTTIKGKVEGPGPFSPSFGTESATLPSIPNLPRQGEFDFLVQSTATAPHLVIAADIAIYVGVAEQLDLIARVATADDMETVVTVHYEQATEAPSPNAAVKATGFAKLPLPTPGAGSGGHGGGRSDRLTPTTTNPSNPNADDAGDNGSGPSGSATGPAELGGGAVGAIGDWVWNDVNKNGVQDSTEAGVAGILIHLFSPGANGRPGDPDDILLRSVRTDALGHYLFAGLQPGAYFIQLDITSLPAGYIITTPNVGTDDRDSDADTLGRDSVTNLEAGEVDLSHDVGIHL